MIEPYTKEKQLNKNRIKPKKECTFGKKKYPWSNKGKNAKQKIKKTDVIDEDYLKWLSQKACVITGQKAKRGASAYDLHIHHIYSRNKGRNDYLTVPLMGFVHSWGDLAYHSNTKDDYIKKHKLMIEDIIEYFEDCANEFLKEYKELNKIQKKHLTH